MKINLAKEKIRFGLIGAGKLICDFSRMLIKRGFPNPIIITYKRSIHQRDQILLQGNRNYEDVFEFCETMGIKLIEAENVNDDIIIEQLVSANVNIVFSMKSRWIIKKRFIEIFKGNVINIHQGNLPFERGGTTASQRILNDVKKVGVTIHVITPNIDAGAILYKETTDLKLSRPTQDDMNDVNMSLSIKVLVQLLDDLENCREIKESFQDNDKAIYLPQLYTELNGAIDWSWTAEEIERFVRTFGPPFPGAFTFYDGKKISILKSYVEKSSIKFHPFYAGRIIGKKSDGSVKIATIEDILVVTDIVLDYKEYLPRKKLRISRILYTPYDILMKAKTDTKLSLDMKPPETFN